MEPPAASRPYMPGYDTAGPTEGTGLLAWSWAEKQLETSRNFWAVTVWPDGRPHAMPVWAVWDRETQWLWFTTSVGSRKARNVAGDARCVVTTANADDPVIIEGTAEVVSDAESIARVISLVNAKYATSYPVDFLDPAVNATIRVRPRRAFGLLQADFTGSPTRWSFEASAAE
jgi:general stress protein 26